MGKKGVGRPRKDRTDVGIYIRAPKELAERLKADAQANYRDQSFHIRFLLEYALENYAKKS